MNKDTANNPRLLKVKDAKLVTRHLKKLLPIFAALYLVSLFMLLELYAVLWREKFFSLKVVYSGGHFNSLELNECPKNKLLRNLFPTFRQFPITR